MTPFLTALAKELVADQGEASKRIFLEVQNAIAMMFLGNEPDYVEMDPTAQTKRPELLKAALTAIAAENPQWRAIHELLRR